MTKLKVGDKVIVKSGTYGFTGIGSEGIILNSYGSRILIRFSKIKGADFHSVPCEFEIRLEDVKLLEKAEIQVYGIVKFLRSIEATQLLERQREEKVRGRKTIKVRVV